MTKSKRLIKDAARFTVSGYISSTCGLFSAIVVRRILDPFLMGIYSELLLVFEYAKYNHLGALDALDRQIPYYSGKGQTDKKEESARAALSFSLAASLVCAAALTLFSLVMGGRLSPALSVGLKIVGIMVVVQSVSTFYVTMVRGHHRFGPLSAYVIILAVSDIVFKLFLGLIFGLTGILWASVATLGISLLYLMKKGGVRIRVSLRIPFGVLKALIMIGFPLILSGFAFMVLRSVDRIMIIAYLTKEELGLYSIAIMVHSFVFQLPNLIYTVLFPRFYEAFGNTEDVSKLRGYLEKPTIAFAYIFPLLIGLAAIALPVLIHYILPKYTAGIPAATILLFGTFFLSITNMYGYLLVALKRQVDLVIIGVSGVAVSFALNFVFINFFHLGIEGVAAACTVSYFIYSVILIGYAMRWSADALIEKLKFFVSIFSPIAWAAAVLAALQLFLRYRFFDLKSDVITAAAGMSIFFLLMVPLMVMVNKKISIFGRLRDAGIGIGKR